MRANLSPDMQLAERLLDTLQGRSCIDEGLGGPEPSFEQAREALLHLAPALQHLRMRAAALYACLPHVGQAVDCLLMCFACLSW